LEVIDRVGFDSFNADHGVIISRSKHSHLVGGGGMDSKGIYIVDAHPGNLGLVQFREADGTPYMFACDHHANIATSAFHAGVHNNPSYYRDTLPERFLEDDARPGVAGSTVNEWVDEYNNFHFYILQKNNYDGIYGTFLSYDVAVRNSAPDAFVIEGNLDLYPIGTSLVPASVGNFSRQTFRLTNNGAEYTDIVRITLEGALAENQGQWIATKDQDAVIHNNLFAVAPGETIEFDVFIKTPEGHTGKYYFPVGDLTVKASSETNPANVYVSDVLGPMTSMRGADANGVTVAQVSLARNASTQLNVNANKAGFAGEIIWSVNNPTFATITADGVITARNLPGVVIASARCAITGVTTSMPVRIV